MPSSAGRVARRSRHCRFTLGQGQVSCPAVRAAAALITANVITLR